MLAAALSAQAAAADEKRPGFGAVASVIPVHPQADSSAAAGGSAPGEASSAKPRKPAYLLRIGMDDGSIQVRQLSRKFSAGEHVLLTNAGDVLPD